MLATRESSYCSDDDSRDHSSRAFLSLSLLRRNRFRDDDEGVLSDRMTQADEREGIGIGIGTSSSIRKDKIIQSAT